MPHRRSGVDVSQTIVFGRVLEFVLLVPEGHPLAGESTVGWSDLRDHEFIDFRESWGVRSLNDAACTAQGVERRIRCTVDDIHTLLDLIHRGLGIALVPQHVAEKPQASGLVTLPLPAGLTPPWVVSAITSTRAESSAARLLEILGLDGSAPRSPDARTEGDVPVRA
jgi:DNA-binding transcriptional LysR family regulator